MKKASEIYNPVLKRKEITFVVDHPSSGTPSLFETRRALASMSDVELDNVYISKMYTLSGTNRTIVRAEVYDTPDAAKRVVPKHIQMRNMPPSEKEGEEKARKKPTKK